MYVWNYIPGKYTLSILAVAFMYAMLNKTIASVNSLNFTIVSYNAFAVVCNSVTHKL